MAEDKIIEALTSNNLELFRVAITTPGVLINDIFDYGVLHYMIRHYPDVNIEFYKSLLELESCDINKSIPFLRDRSVDKYTDQPILILNWDRKELLDLFLKHPRIDLAKLDIRRKCIINKAIDRNDKEILEFIIEHGDINMTHILMDNKTAPLNYAMDNNMELFKFLIDNPKVNINKSSVFPPIQYAIESDNFEAFKLLVDKGANTLLSFRHRIYGDIESNSNSNSNSEEPIERYPTRTSIVTLFEFTILNNKREMFEYLLSKDIDLIKNIKNFKFFNVVKSEYVEILLNKMDIFKDEYLSHIKELATILKDKYIHLLFDKLVEGYMSKKLKTLGRIKDILHKRCIKKKDLELYKKCVNLVLDDGSDDEYLLALIHLLKVEDIDYLKQLVGDEEYNFINLLDRIKFSDSVIRENKVDDFVQVIIGDLDDNSHLGVETLEQLIIYEKTIKLIIPHLNYDNSPGSNGHLLFNKICQVLEGGPQTHYAHINDLLRYIIDNSDFCEKYAKYNVPELLYNLEFNQELMAYLLSKTNLSDLTNNDAEYIETNLWDLYHKNSSAFSNFFEELAKLKFDNLHYPINSGLFFRVMEDEAGAEAFDVIMDGFIENHPDFIRTHAKEILELEYKLDNHDFFKHYPLIMSLEETSIDLLNLFLVEEDDRRHGRYYTLKDLDDEEYENIDKLLDYDNVIVQNLFGALIGVVDCPIEIIRKIIDHSKFEPYAYCEYNDSRLTPLDWILSTIGSAFNEKNSRTNNLIEILNYFINHDKVEELNGYAIDSYNLIEQINKVPKGHGFFKMDVNYYEDSGLIDILGHALQIVLKHPKFTYNIENGMILKQAGMNCISIPFIKYLLSKPEIDYNNGTLQAIISERRAISSPTEMLEIVKMFLELVRFDVNAKDVQDRTILHEAIYNNSIEIVKLILEQPALDITITNYQGKNYLEIARKAERSEIQELLKARGLIDDKKERLERLELEYEERMKAQGRIMRTRIRDIIGNFELVLTEADDPNPNNTLYQTTICPFCLVYLEKESPGECLYMKHQCAHEIRNEELMTKYLGAARIDEGFELCVICGRPGLNHGHCSFDQPPEGRQLEGIQEGGHSWICNDLVGGGRRIEMIARITIMASYIKKKFDESQTTGEKLKYDRALIKTLTDLVDNVLSSQSDERDEIFERAEEIFDRSKFDKNSKIPSYAKFNATNEEVREIEAQLEAERQLEERRRGKMRASDVNEEEHKGFIEPMKLIHNDGSLLCIVCSEPMPILYQAHDEDTFYLCSSDLQGQMMDVEPGKSKKCILGCNLSKKKVDARGILLPGQYNTISEYERLRLTKQIYRDEVEKLDDGEFFSKDYSMEQPMNIAQPLEEMEKTIEKIEKSEYRSGEGSSSGASSSSNGAGPSNPAEAIMNALTREMRRLQRYREKHGEDPEEGEIIENSNSE